MIFLLDIFIEDVISVLCVIPPVCFGLGSGWLLKSIVEDVQNDLFHLNVSKRIRRRDERELKIHFCNVVKLHTDVKELGGILNF